LSQRPLLDGRIEPFGDAIPQGVERRRLARNALIDGHDVKAVARSDELTENSRRPQPKESLLELRHGVTARDLAEISVVLAGWTVRQLARQSGGVVGISKLARVKDG
jgi:hypothetical protein